jgi:hypothetical protein
LPYSLKAMAHPLQMKGARPIAGRRSAKNNQSTS